MLTLQQMVFRCRYPPSVHPVLAMRGAPASFPAQREHRELQRHLVFSQRIEDEAQKYIDKKFAGKKFVGIHLRNGADWVRYECNIVSILLKLLHHMCLALGVVNYLIAF